ncbi:glycoside hydrolase family 43 protein [Baudoinia panamericana UAMH 10762]|uniref:Glycoside hydrolase family 43 protein n=1 Tax=Baudoinia panamericana (strain UAMH 10762) TaxID=717646 RepID=M2MZ71_BAUPA|nr:glycoside hydrolase family 43 protein [Baudoinia panamericana UAMH 10762]EMC91620.1 glycoside hydrolase family 43 protein [Baudoinia panamericana UAMH 10762]
MGGANFPDPSVIRVADGWHAFSTNAVVNGKLVHVQNGYTPDYNTWTLRSGVDAMPDLAPWVYAGSPRVWAPDVIQLPDGSFLMYYTAAYKKMSNLHCLGWAKSRYVDGPYIDTSATPWICPTAQGGAIDPAGYLNSDGTRWVVYKIDGNASGHGGSCGNTVAPIVQTPIMLQQVNAADGHTLIGDPIQLITNGPADGPYVEAPSLSYLGGKYVLFFSSQCYQTPQYDVSYATAPSITGPYTKYGPLLVTGSNGMTAPGGLDLAINGNHAIWHANYGSGRAAFTGFVALSGNIVTASTFS